MEKKCRQPGLNLREGRQQLETFSFLKTRSGIIIANCNNEEWIPA
jgi:hypothetical protein